MSHNPKPERRHPKVPARVRILGPAVAALLIALAPWALFQSTQVRAAGHVKVFNSTETKYKGLKPFPKWTGALERYLKEKAGQNTGASCQSSQFNKCQYDRWMKLINLTRGDKPLAQLKRVNGFMNRYRYIVDPINWGVKDYWATPGQFFQKYGDCEDYAIAKYLSLRMLGWETEKMRIVVLQDLNLKIAHAVLLVQINGTYMLLDNQIAIVVDSKRIRHYRPIYSVNEKSWWRHRVAG